MVFDQCKKALGSNWDSALVQKTTQGTGKESLAWPVSSKKVVLRNGSAPCTFYATFGVGSKEEMMAVHFSKRGTLLECWRQSFFIDGITVDGWNYPWTWAEWNGKVNVMYLTNSVYDLPK